MPYQCETHNDPHNRHNGIHDQSSLGELAESDLVVLQSKQLQIRRVLLHQLDGHRHFFAVRVLLLDVPVSLGELQIHVHDQSGIFPEFFRLVDAPGHEHMREFLEARCGDPDLFESLRVSYGFDLFQQDRDGLFAVLREQSGEFPGDGVGDSEVHDCLGAEAVALVVVESDALDRHRDVVPGHGTQGHQAHTGLQRQRGGAVVGAPLWEDTDAPASLQLLLHHVVDLRLVQFRNDLVGARGKDCT